MLTLSIIQIYIYKKIKFMRVAGLNKLSETTFIVH